ncbi:putative Mov34/MPN/PAD-1 [Candidatus Terasakiella magnetica]|uniref:Putative Mov34/MPN/PAD-1 n=1 Tax=Candidatus Terasakiella magnetica TaxID=1867952 RepID=A0A1C3RLF0_9PROT|nr:M67 family metallopeptidase [Candidatus Terasakiella magnetica]SCA58019.1 putative Mov34/MPN/PAD-1 [Candidatus Terasakiella magnetica]
MILSQADFDRLLDFTKQAHPEECCGLIVGDGETVERLMPSANISTGDKTKSFELDPKVRFELIRESGERSLMGFYHSHPNGNPFPSKTDRSMVYEPELLWVITTCKEIKAFRFNETNQDFEEIPIRVKL